MAHCDLCRVSVHAGTVGVDLALPAHLSVAALMPAILDAVASHGYHPDGGGDAPYRLMRPGMAALDGSMTLAQHAIRDGTVLLVTRSAPRPPVARCDDTAEAVSTALRTTTRPTGRVCRAAAGSWLATASAVVLVHSGFGGPAAQPAAAAGVAAGLGFLALIAAVLTHRVHRDDVSGTTLALWATGFAALAGFLAVPAGPGAPNVLLSATAAAATCVLAIGLTDVAHPALTAVAAVAVLAAVAALAGVLTRAPLPVLGSVAAAVSVGLLQISARVSAASAGLSARWEVDDAPAANQLRGRTIRAHATLTGLVAALSIAVALGAIGTAFGASPHGGIVLAAVTGAVLLLRARSHADRCQALALVAGGTVAVTAALAVAPLPPLWQCAATAAPAGVALYGVCAPAPRFSPAVGCALEGLEYLALTAIPPLTCWVCGLFGAARGLSL